MLVAVASLRTTRQTYDLVGCRFVALRHRGKADRESRIADRGRWTIDEREAADGGWSWRWRGHARASSCPDRISRYPIRDPPIRRSAILTTLQTRGFEDM